MAVTPHISEHLGTPLEIVQRDANNRGMDVALEFVVAYSAAIRSAEQQGSI